MITGMTISGFRTFAELRIDQLTRVNLFVGTNNAGKTSVLEAAELAVVGTPVGLRRSLFRRAEEVLVSREERGGVLGPALDPSHLFHSHALFVGKSFSILAEGEIQRWVRCRVVETESEGEADEDEAVSAEAEPLAPALALSFESHYIPEEKTVRLTPYGSLPEVRRLLLYSPPEPSPLVNFLGTEAVTAPRLGQLWDAVVLTPEEERVVDALRIIEPRIERIAFLGEGRQSSRSIFLKLSDSERRLPLGSVGDGLKRLLALTLRLFSARGGFLLVDEIDTGLHYSVMADMWRLIIEAARRLDVQVLATTHSLDCVRALAWVREQSPDAAGEATLHRIEKDARKTVVYDMNELAIAARNHIEVR